MAKLIINHQDAQKMHQDFYTDDFEVIEVKRSGSFDVPPWSFFYGASDLNSWEGLLSTNGKKLVFSKGGMLAAGKITKKWEVDLSELTYIDRGTFKSRFNFTKKINGLTTRSFFEGLLLLCCGVLPFFLYKSTKLRLRLTNSFGNNDKFFALLPEHTK